MTSSVQAGSVEAGRDASRRAAGNVAAVAVAQVLGKVLTLAWTVAAARVLTQSDFGELNFVLSLALVLSAVAEWGFDPALVRLASRDPAARDRHYTEAMLAETLVGLLLFGGFLAAVLPTQAGRDQQLATTFIFIAVFVDLWSDTARSVGAAAAYQGRTSIALVVQRLATAALVLTLLGLGTGLAGVAGGMLGGYIVGWITNVLALRTFGSRLRLRAVTRAGLWDFARLSLPIGVSSMILVVVARIDTVLIGLLRDNRHVATYAAAYKLFETVLFVMFAVSSATFPLMSAHANDTGRVRVVARSAGAATLVLFAPFAAVCLVDAGPILHIVYGGSYGHDSAGALRWLALAPIAYSLAYIGGTALIAVGRNRGLVVSSAAAAVVNVAANLAVIPRWGGTGAALVTTVSYAVEAFVALMLLRRLTGPLHVLSIAPEAIVAAVALGVALWVVPAAAVVEVPVGFVLYLGAWLVLARRRVPEQVAFLVALLPGRSPA